jgi:hypothetical protein
LRKKTGGKCRTEDLFRKRVHTKRVGSETLFEVYVYFMGKIYPYAISLKLGSAYKESNSTTEIPASGLNFGLYIV